MWKNSFSEIYSCVVVIFIQMKCKLIATASTLNKIKGSCFQSTKKRKLIANYRINQ